jgi:CheY-like chemotaxis protein
MIKLLRRLIGEDIDLVWLPCENLWPIKMDPSQVDQILANLCVNAKDAIADVGKITIETQNVSLKDASCAEIHGVLPGEYVVLTVSDNGKGMNKATISKIFEPFFTTKDVGKGTGLGLATVYGIVKQNFGFINVYSEPGYGSAFKIYLPILAAEVARIHEQGSPDTITQGSETILLVEDDTVVLELVKMMLENCGYLVLASSTPEEAIRIAQEKACEIDLLVTDVIMPGMTGKTLEKELRSFCPELKCLYMSGYTGNVITHHGAIDVGVNFIPKPFSMQEMAAKVRKVLDKE